LLCCILNASVLKLKTQEVNSCYAVLPTLANSLLTDYDNFPLRFEM
jgi:hypothetical protein